MPKCLYSVDMGRVESGQVVSSRVVLGQLKVTYIQLCDVSATAVADDRIRLAYKRTEIITHGGKGSAIY